MLLRELQESGYEGGISQLKAFLAPFKRDEPEPLVWFETPPGKQMQADFTVIRRGRAPLLALVATLGYSRASLIRFTAREDAATLCEAFVYFGGTHEHVFIDFVAGNKIVFLWPMPVCAKISQHRPDITWPL